MGFGVKKREYSRMSKVFRAIAELRRLAAQHAPGVPAILPASRHTILPAPNFTRSHPLYFFCPHPFSGISRFTLIVLGVTCLVIIPIPTGFVFELDHEAYSKICGHFGAFGHPGMRFNYC